MTAQIIDFAAMVKKLENPPNRIRELRKAKGLTQGELADAIGVKQNLIGRYETGDRELSLPRLRQIARALGTDVGDLLAPEDNTHGLTDDERDVIAAMRQGEGHARMIATVAEGTRTFGHAPEDQRKAG